MVASSVFLQLSLWCSECSNDDRNVFHSESCFLRNALRYGSFMYYSGKFLVKSIVKKMNLFF